MEEPGRLQSVRLLLIVPWTVRRSNQSIFKEISPEYSLEGLILKLKLQYFGPPDAKNRLIGKDPDAGKDRRHEEKGTTVEKAEEPEIKLPTSTGS